MIMMVEGEDNIPRTFLPSLHLKIKLVQVYVKYILVFYMAEILKEGFVNIFSPQIHPLDEYGPIVIEAYISVV